MLVYCIILDTFLLWNDGVNVVDASSDEILVEE
jgi:hypothetical protein